MVISASSLEVRMLARRLGISAEELAEHLNRLAEDEGRPVSSLPTRRIEAGAVYSNEEACVLLGGISSRTLYNLRKTFGVEPSIRIGGKILWRGEELLELVERMKKGG